MARNRRPLSVYLLPRVMVQLEEEAKTRGKKKGSLAAEILTRELLLPPKPAGTTGNLTVDRSAR